MKKIAIISDIHGNATALKAVLKDIENKKINDIICLGDTVLKNSESHLCLELVKKHCSIILKGNTDDCVATLEEQKEEHIWTYQQLTKEDIQFLKQLPTSYDCYVSGHFIRFLHATPHKLNGIMNIANPESNTSYQEMFQNAVLTSKTEEMPDIVFFGHTHTSAMAHYGNRQLINVGAVGCPVELLNQDEFDPKNRLTTMANYTILEGEFDSKELNSIGISFQKVSYSLDEQIEILEKSNMPNKELAMKEITTGIYKRR